MEQMRQNEAGALTAQAIPQKDVEQACFHALGLIGRNCEYLDQHLAQGLLRLARRDGHTEGSVGLIAVGVGDQARIALLHA